MFSAQAAANKKTGGKESAVSEDSVLRDIMAELKHEPVLLNAAPKNTTTTVPPSLKNAGKFRLIGPSDRGPFAFPAMVGWCGC